MFTTSNSSDKETPDGICPEHTLVHSEPLRGSHSGWTLKSPGRLPCFASLLPGCRLRLQRLPQRRVVRRNMHLSLVGRTITFLACPNHCKPENPKLDIEDLRCGVLGGREDLRYAHHCTLLVVLNILCVELRGIL